jgi:predicted nucleic acid-binding protein
MKLLIDSDFLFGLFVPDDLHHKRARQIWIDLVKRECEIFVLKFAVQETATVLSHKIDQHTAISFVDKLPELGLKVLAADVEMEEDGWKIFKAQTKKGTSYVDCVNLAVIQKFKFDGILSFDKFYPKSLRICH